MPPDSSEQPKRRYEVLDGTSYYCAYQLRFPIWKHKTLLVGESLQGESGWLQAPLADFSLIDDFEVHLVNSKPSEGSSLGFRILFFSHLRGYLGFFLDGIMLNVI